MAKEIKTAGQIRASIVNQNKFSTTEEAKHKRAVEAEKARLESYEDLRDDVLSVLKNNNMSWEDVHGRLGPHPSTLHAWETGVIHFPQLRKMQSALRTCGYDLGIIEGRRHKEAAE
jgi:phosphoglycolate phosphatase-like HAD superfamily hydrolase